MLEDVYDDGDPVLTRIEAGEELTCVVCGCSDSNPCPGGCSWASTSPPICSNCT